MGPGRLRGRASAAAVLACAAAGLAALPPPVAAQDDLTRQIRESQRRLEEIRAERARLQREVEGFRNRARDVAGELRNIERQLSASRSVLAEIEFQLEATTGHIEENTRNLVRARERVREGHAVLQRRLRDIYKMGTLHSVRVLLGADSFTDLIYRYRYLQLMAAADRALVRDVEARERHLDEQNVELQRNRAELGRLRSGKVTEVTELRTVEDRHRTTLEEYRERQQRTESRLEQLDRDEERMSGLIDDLELRRRELERRRSGGDGPATLGTSDAGALDWPVEGDVLYRFGRQRRPDGTVLRWNGIGIAAPAGTPVRAVKGGDVVMAGPFEGYGPTVVLSHGDGFYTLYLYLEEVGVVEGRTVEAGQVVGTVGGSDTPEGPHLEFQIRTPVAGGSPQAQDPLEWLRARPAGPGDR